MVLLPNESNPWIGLRDLLEAVPLIRDLSIRASLYPKIEPLLNSYASPGTKVEIGFPDDYAGSQLMNTIGGQSKLNGLHHMMETPAIVRKIFWAAQNGYDAVIQGEAGIMDMTGSPDGPPMLLDRVLGRIRRHL